MLLKLNGFVLNVCDAMQLMERGSLFTFHFELCQSLPFGYVSIEGK